MARWGASAGVASAFHDRGGSPPDAPLEGRRRRNALSLDFDAAACTPKSCSQGRAQSARAGRARQSVARSKAAVLLSGALEGEQGPCSTVLFFFGWSCSASPHREGRCSEPERGARSCASPHEPGAVRTMACGPAAIHRLARVTAECFRCYGLPPPIVGAGANRPAGALRIRWERA